MSSFDREGSGATGPTSTEAFLSPLPPAKSERKFRRSALGLALSGGGESIVRHRLVVGIDYGTTFSGISFVTTDKTEIDDINVIRAWPGKDGEWKTPTRIAYATENSAKGLRSNAWGYQVAASMVSCSWTKLLLDSSATDTDHDDPQLRAAIDGGMLRLPPEKQAKNVCEDFLRELYNHLSARLERSLGQHVLQSTPMDCWLTVPAVWSDSAQNATRAAAKAAGFGARVGDTISVITEPEAAAIAVLKKQLQPGALNPPRKNEYILICDCGGGTVDITTYVIAETVPQLVFEEAVVGVGGKCGATYIDRNLQRLMEQRFGRAFTDIDMRRRGPGSQFMASWERIKRSFGGPGDYLPQELGPLIMRDVYDSMYYDDEEGNVHLTREDVEGLFEPVVAEIVLLVAQQANDVWTETGQKIDRIILIGGFGDSEYLYTRLQQWTARYSVQTKVECPDHPQAAIVRGAALRGLEGTAPRKKRCRKHYGIAYNIQFREGTDPEEKAVHDEWDDRKLCRGRMKWMINKGEPLDGDTVREVGLQITRDKADVSNNRLVSTCYLYSCSLEQPPEYDDHPRVQRVGKIKTDFSKADRSQFSSKREHLRFMGKKKWRLPYELQVSFGSRDGVLAFKTLINGALSGTASISFD